MRSAFHVGLMVAAPRTDIRPGSILASSEWNGIRVWDQGRGKLRAMPGWNKPDTLWVTVMYEANTILHLDDFAVVPACTVLETSYNRDEILPLLQEQQSASGVYLFGVKTGSTGQEVIVGDGGNAIAGDWGVAIAGDWGTAVAGFGGVVKAGEGGLLRFSHDGIEKRVGVDGVKPDTFYCIHDAKVIPA